MKKESQVGNPVNKLVLENWWAQPIHCPFCGEALQPDDQVSCKHLLYVIAAGNFLFRSKRFDEALGIEPESGVLWPEFTEAESSIHGCPYDVAIKILGMFINNLGYENRGPTDSSMVGFAAMEEELCAFGVVHCSPYN